MLAFECVIVLPELEHGDEVRRLVFVSGVLVVGGVAFLEGPFARVLDFEERCDHERLTEHALGRCRVENPADAGIDG